MPRKNKASSTLSSNDDRALIRSNAAPGRSRTTRLVIERRKRTDAERQQFEKAVQRLLAELVRAHRHRPEGER